MAIRILRTFYRGEYEDAHFYMGHFILIRPDGNVSFINLERACFAFENKFSDVSPMATILFSRNDWLNSGLFERIYRNRIIAKQIRSILEDLNNRVMFLFDNAQVEYSFNLNFKDDILDTKPYARHLYVGTTKCFMDFIFDWKDLQVKNSATRHDGKTLYINAAYGTVNISAGNDGLLSSTHELDNFDSVSTGGMEQIDSISIRSNWSDYNLLNFSNNKTATLIPTTVESTGEYGGFEKRVVRKIEKESKIDIFKSMSFLNVNKDDIQFVFNGRHNVFLNSYEGKLRTLGIELLEKGLELTYIKEYEHNVGRILSVSPFIHGYLLETDDRVLFFHDSKFEVLHYGPVISIRTFPSSKRYKNIVLVVQERGINIYSVFDERKISI